MVRVLNKILGFNKYKYINMTQDDSSSIFNPLSSYNDRFRVKNQEIHNALYKNNVGSSFLFRKKVTESKTQPIQSFYLNPVYHEKVFDI